MPPWPKLRREQAPALRYTPLYHKSAEKTISLPNFCVCHFSAKNAKRKAELFHLFGERCVAQRIASFADDTDGNAEGTQLIDKGIYIAISAAALHEV